MSLKKRTISIGTTSSNHHFSGDMLVFRGVFAYMNGSFLWYMLVGYMIHGASGIRKGPITPLLWGLFCHQFVHLFLAICRGEIK